jgi:hypothetical protein
VVAQGRGDDAREDVPKGRAHLRQGRVRRERDSQRARDSRVSKR